MAKGSYTYKDGPYKSKRKAAAISWERAGESSLHAFVSKVTDLGYTVCLSRTQDGSSLSLTVMAGNEKIKEYISATDDIVNIFSSIMDYLDVV